MKKEQRLAVAALFVFTLVSYILKSMLTIILQIYR